MVSISVQKSIELDLSLIDHYDQLLHHVEHEISLIAKKHDADSYFRLRSIPGIGRILGLVMLQSSCSMLVFVAGITRSNFLLKLLTSGYPWEESISPKASAFLPL